MEHDFSQSDRCRSCGASIHSNDEACSGDMSGYEDYVHDSYRD